METQIVYCDETGDDGLNTKSSDVFILTSILVSIPAKKCTQNIF